MGFLSVYFSVKYLYFFEFIFSLFFVLFCNLTFFRLWKMPHRACSAHTFYVIYFVIYNIFLIKMKRFFENYLVMQYAFCVLMCFFLSLSNSNASEKYFNDKLNYVKQGFLSEHFKNYVEADEDIDWERECLISNTSIGVYSTLDRTYKIDGENCLIVADLIKGDLYNFILNKNFKELSFFTFDNNKLYIGNTYNIYIFEVKSRNGNKIEFKSIDNYRYPFVLSASGIKQLGHSLFIPYDYAYKKYYENPIFFCTLDSNNKKTKQIHLNLSKGLFFNYFAPRNSISASNSYVASCDNTEYNIYIYDYNGIVLDTLKGEFAGKNYMTKEEIEEFEKNIDYYAQPPQIIGIVNESLLFAKINILRNIHFIDDNTLLVCYTSPLNTTTDPFEANFDNVFKYDIWQKIDGKWQVLPENKALSNYDPKQGGIVSKNRIFIGPKYSVASKYFITFSNIPFVLDNEITYTEYEKRKDEFYMDNNDNGAYIIYTLAP